MSTQPPREHTPCSFQITTGIAPVLRASLCHLGDGRECAMAVHCTPLSLHTYVTAHLCHCTPMSLHTHVSWAMQVMHVAAPWQKVMHVAAPWQKVMHVAAPWQKQGGGSLNAAARVQERGRCCAFTATHISSNWRVWHPRQSSFFRTAAVALKGAKCRAETPSQGVCAWCVC